jgi:cysteine desulfurase
MRVYLDHNSTSPMRGEVRRLLSELASEPLGNPSSPHASGRRARALVDTARERVAAALGVHEEEVIFTSGATESNHLALVGCLQASPGALLVTTAAEHSSILACARALEADRHPISIVPVDDRGLPSPEAVAAACAGGPVGLVSVSAANNETGALPELGVVVHALRRLPGGAPPLHTDAVQALGRVPVRLREWGASLASFSAHKIGGPPGVGVLWRAREVALEPVLRGGGQEQGLRAGTENVPGIAGAALAIELAVREQAEFAARAARLTGNLWAELARRFPGARLVGPPLESKRRLPNTLCVLLPGTSGKVLVTRLDLGGLEVSAGSACASGSVEPSHVLLAMGLAREDARSGVRISLGMSTTPEDCKRALAIFDETLASSRAT